MGHERIVFIDYLKVLGLLCIILAHVCKNPSIFQLRNFDVPLMVIISGFLAVDSYKRSVQSNNSLLNYYWKRIKRLLFPTWIFLAIYFILSYIFITNSGGAYPYNYKTVLSSFLLLNGIGYVWIIRIYLICAFLTPIIYYFNDKIKSGKMKLAILLVIYVLYELFVFLGYSDLNAIFKYFVAYAIPYGLIYILGMLSKNTSYKKDYGISLLFLITFIASAFAVASIFNGFQPTQIMKYPPTIYYVSYSLFASFLLLSIFKQANLKRFIVIEFLSNSSLWIYLWHIMFVKLATVFLGDVHWTVNYLAILAAAIGITFIQNKILDLLEHRSINIGVLNVFRG